MPNWCLNNLQVARWTAGGAWEAVFSTPWDPPSRFLRSLAERYRTLRFELESIEPGNCICGKTVYDHGILQSTTQYPKGSEDYKRLDITCEPEPEEEEEPCKT